MWQPLVLQVGCRWSQSCWLLDESPARPQDWTALDCRDWVWQQARVEDYHSLRCYWAGRANSAHYLISPSNWYRLIFKKHSWFLSIRGERERISKMWTIFIEYLNREGVIINSITSWHVGKSNSHRYQTLLSLFFKKCRTETLEPFLPSLAEAVNIDSSALANSKH